MLKVLLKIKPGMGEGYDWVECCGCGADWQVPHYAESGGCGAGWQVPHYAESVG